MSFWGKLSQLGVKDDMPLYLKKSTVLFNQVIRFFMFAVSLGSFMLYFFWDQTLTAKLLVSLLLFLGFALYLNITGRVKIAILLLSIILPFYVLFISVVSKLMGETLSITLYIVPRFLIIIFTMIPAVFFGFSDIRKAIVGILTGVLCFALFDVVHRLFGINYQDLPYKPSEFKALAGGLSLLFFMVILVLLFLQNINNSYEKIVTRQKEDLKIQFDIVTNQKEELSIKNHAIAQQNEEINAQKDEIAAQRDLVTHQKEHIEEIHKDLTDSIHYAERIQKAVLPDIEKGFTFCKGETFTDYFILYKQRDIVSGDFYWIKFVETRLDSSLQKYLIFCVADCTGHGVPGAFMSMLGVSFLNEIVNKYPVETCHPPEDERSGMSLQANEILNQLRDSIINALHQSGKSGESKDGMDIALCIIDGGCSDARPCVATTTMQFAGANNPLYIVKTCRGMSLQPRHDEILPDVSAETNALIPKPALFEVKADKQPVAIYECMQPFTKHEIEVRTGDILYLCSDGYEDQFGGPKGKKYMSKRLKELLVDTCPGISLQIKTMAGQKDVLNRTIEYWKNGYDTIYEQTDDITILGIRI